ncbi:2-amino-4-hydroxy-6-hydroxymethyldihydropteridine pyrophosphokinase (EC 2.7.6.3) [uncultured Gammaproteobacteria bacterium]|uniref:2-amino-4-hydroxy-6- hydroxymethyldihydropteridine diphosphokinase n=1 Tax=Bathymodiolus heckerae thiotrophic gill symbiont TaxID=1052212 RepID=UPI0010B147C3|nr:2-amino-4-hydroxy-6-hydroxymethyldihydropteridine diphosphokinase [Bathymodiolus heckerae thiotrophic gill symbiont]CAC9533683.1 2-amino-4-hydroxy-6-hydroxymethyldihydropteridine pyrophosphokinase (EC 2.7.6.3) [uncultured Gammaproteobacteria bacterium]CAC9603610.1 2-amino-4-hydroxy-6-hydroxymethyldihydropteridine pyrophosphokinase (EC 2.7.6.3) [uncultured Gammaproteobacteria bacterium]CAC9966104.1 2-amino-4-hydroxy-6-hydroxymethyldihydropteridine pyrophosphokinase (EC 2.7.6.3) [uncultured Gam
MAKIHINIGSNQNREANIVGAIDFLRLNFSDIKISDIFESPAQGFKGDDFYNVGINATTKLTPSDVNLVLKDIEKKLGRETTQPKFSSRLIDLDLVTYDLVVNLDLNIPRDDILKYNFVLLPLAQLNSDEYHPISGKTYQQLSTTMRQLKSYNIQILNGAES